MTPIIENQDNTRTVIEHRRYLPAHLEPATLDGKYVGPAASAAAIAAAVAPKLDSTTAASTYATKAEARALGWAIVTDTQWAGGVDVTGVADSAAAINAAIASGKTVWLPAGILLISSTQVRPIPGTRILGSGKYTTILKAAPGLTTSVILGTSGNAAANVELRDFGIDGNYSGGATIGQTVQISNGPDFKASNMLFKNCYGGGVLLQGFGSAPNGCPRSIIEHSRFDTLGQGDGSTGHGVTLSGQTDHSRVVNNTLVGIKGGMGVAGVGSASGNPDHFTVTGNTITMSPSTIGFEGIGFDVNSTYGTITGNVITDSQDNGISSTGTHCAIAGNTIDGAVNHGIWAGAYSTVTGNTIRNCGKEFTVDGLTYGGVAINLPIGCIVSGNVIIDDQGAHTMGYLVKAVGGTLGGNIVGPNTGSGWNQALPYNGLTATTDITIDTQTNPTGITLNRIFGPGATPLTLSNTANALSQFWIGNTSTTIVAQLGVRTNSTTRATQTNQAVTSQTADLQNFTDTSGTVKSGFNAAGTFISDNATAGVVMKSPNAHYWRKTISDAGVVSYTDLGTTRPTTT